MPVRLLPCSPSLRRFRFAGACLLLALASACGAQGSEAAEKPALGLMGTIPVYWGEAGEVGDLLRGGAATHWARDRLEAHYTLEPLDALTPEALAGVRYLLMAQPRGLGGAENVALDDWVRKGGHLLLFADPMLTGGSRFAIGDRRRPQDVILLSPILSHWGLEMEFDVEAPEGLVLVDDGGVAIPVNRPGHFVKHDGDCALTGQDTVAHCRIGAGEATVVADAAVLDLYQPHPAAAAALDGLVKQVFAETGDNAGLPPRVAGS